ncbi:plasma kallikrein-like [Malaya genurostris]|uniref:plasma kallikrein-like n=1 Tax=Malaya genurostris TaxID=325434 RepID=UPI0026F388F8|nr:plasma kallikrein-like [Malaya genurostris]
METTTTNDVVRELSVMFSRYGIPSAMKADNAPQLSGQCSEFKEFCEANGVRLMNTIPYWPQSNGEVERQNRSILKRLRIAQELGRDWRQELCFYLLTYHSTKHPTTVCTLRQSGTGASSPEQGSDSTECGRRYHTKPPGNWPFHVLLVKLSTNEHRSNAVEFFCGGTVIGTRFVLTAAHCAIGHDKRPVNVSLLAVHVAIYDTRLRENVPRCSVSSIIIHPDYGADAFNNDVALLRLSDKIEFDQTVQPACLWPATDTGVGTLEHTKATAIGWGIDKTGIFSNILREISQRLPTMDECRMQFGEILQRNSSIICARNLTATDHLNVRIEKNLSSQKRGFASDVFPSVVD